jgi:hypothetical protein
MENSTEADAPVVLDREFCDLMLGLRDMAIRLIEKRTYELFRWEIFERDRVERWFGSADEEMRDYLHTGLMKCKFLLQGFTCQNFVRYLPAWGHNLGCTPLDNNPVAQVCPVDTRSHTIAINREFFELLQISPSKDSQLSTLIHEVTHFRDTFSSVDLRYGLNAARRFTGTPKLSRINADNIAGYVVDGAVYGA